MADSEPSRPRSRVLLISQVYVPDTPAVGQYMADAAAALVAHGCEVRVLTSARAYEDPSIRYPMREVRDGVDVRRVPFSSFGKRSIAHRLLGQSLFLLQVIFHGLFMKRPSAIVVSTSPPMASIAALVIGVLRCAPIKFWAMDLNPDQLIEMGKLSETSLAARAFNALNRALLARSSEVIALDRFMADRLCAKHDVRDKLSVLAPWPHEDHLRPVPHEENPFREEHGLNGKFVVMYSGNHGQTTPVKTVVDAAVRMRDRDDIVFMFIGGGAGKRDVEAAVAEHRPKNLINLPYQPLETLRYSLSAADLHVVTMGDAMVGVIHPCKVYGAMALSRPILLVGPPECHVADLMRDRNFGWRAEHGDVDGLVATLNEAVATPQEDRRAMGEAAADVIRNEYQRDAMVDKFVELVAGPATALATEGAA